MDPDRMDAWEPHEITDYTFSWQHEFDNVGAEVTLGAGSDSHSLSYSELSYSASGPPSNSSQRSESPNDDRLYESGPEAQIPPEANVPPKKRGRKQTLTQMEERTAEPRTPKPAKIPLYKMDPEAAETPEERKVISKARKSFEFRQRRNSKTQAMELELEKTRSDLADQNEQNAKLREEVEFWKQKYEAVAREVLNSNN